MTDETAGAAGQQAPVSILDQARAKLAEITTEKSLPEDAITLFGLVIDHADGQVASVNSALNGVFEAHNELDDRLTAHGETLQGALGQQGAIESGMVDFAERVTALETRPASNVAAVAGVDTRALLSAMQRIEEGRASSALSGNVAAILEDLIAAFVPRADTPAASPADTPLTLDQVVGGEGASGNAGSAPPVEPPRADAGPTASTSSEQSSETTSGETTSGDTASGAAAGAPGGS